MVPADSSSETHLGSVLVATILVATGIAGLVTALLPTLFQRAGVDMIAGIMFIDTVGPVAHVLFPLVFVYGLCERVGGLELPARTLTGVSLTATVLGRYAGVCLGAVLLGRPLPTPLTLVSSADLAAREFAAAMWVGVAMSLLAVGLLGVVGAFGGVGLFERLRE